MLDKTQFSALMLKTEYTSDRGPAESTSEAFASPGQMIWLSLSLLAVAVLLVAEVVHYAVATDLGARDQVQAFTEVHPLCIELGSKYELSCPLAGYGSIRMQCIFAGCGVRDPNLPRATEEFRAGIIARERNDKVASLSVERVFSGNNPEWQQQAHDLRLSQSIKQAAPSRVDVLQRPKDLEEARAIVQERALLISRENAQEWLSSHAN